jgi:hypothetical protein
VSIYHEIHGFVSDPDTVSEPCWHPLFQYTDEYVAKGVFKHLFDMDNPPRYLEMYEDFRYVPATPPKPKRTPEERRERRRRRAERQARQAARDAAKGRSGADAGPKRKRREATA